MTRTVPLALLCLAACRPAGTGVLFSIDGAITLDTIAVEAILPSGPAARDATASMLPTTFLAKLPDQDQTVGFVVQAELAGAPIATVATGPITVRAHEIAMATIHFGGGDGGPGGDLGLLNLVHGGTPPSGAALTGAWGASADDVYFTSLQQGGMNLLRTTTRGASFSPSAAGAVDLYGVWGFGSDDVVLVGDGATILRGKAGAFALQANPGAGHGLRAVWGSTSSDVYIVGEGNTILHSVTGGWVQQSPVGVTTLRAVWGADAAHVWVAGDGGTILFSSGNGVWTAQASGVTTTLRALAGRSATEIYAAGDGGRLLRSSGNGTWTPVASGSTQPLRGLFARSSGISVVGDAWTLLSSSDGVTFGAQPTGLAVDVAANDAWTCVWGSALGELYLAGAGQTIVRLP